MDSDGEWQVERRKSKRSGKGGFGYLCTVCQWPLNEGLGLTSRAKVCTHWERTHSKEKPEEDVTGVLLHRLTHVVGGTQREMRLVSINEANEGRYLPPGVKVGRCSKRSKQPTAPTERPCISNDGYSAEGHASVVAEVKEGLAALRQHIMGCLTQLEYMQRRLATLEVSAVGRSPPDVVVASHAAQAFETAPGPTAAGHLQDDLLTFMDEERNVHQPGEGLSTDNPPYLEFPPWADRCISKGGEGLKVILILDPYGEAKEIDAPTTEAKDRVFTLPHGTRLRLRVDDLKCGYDGLVLQFSGTSAASAPELGGQALQKGVDLVLNYEHDDDEFLLLRVQGRLAWGWRYRISPAAASDPQTTPPRTQSASADVEETKDTEQEKEAPPVPSKELPSAAETSHEKSSPACATGHGTEVTDVERKSVVVDIGAIKLGPGEWSCVMCTLTNRPAVRRCVACGSPKS